MLLIAVDPGLTTGLANLHVLDGMMYAPFATELPPMEAVDAVDLWMQPWVSDSVAVVCENFRQRPGAYSNQPDALHIIGALRYLCWKSGVRFKLQSPAEGKRFATNAKLKKLAGWWHPTPGGHANDAMRHLLLASVQAGIVRGEDLL